MTHNLQRQGFPLQRAVQPRLDRARVQQSVDVSTAELLLQRRRHHAFILTLAHELRQPLSAMLSAMEILHERGSAALPKVVEVIDRQAHHMARLIEQLFESADWAQGTMLLRTERLDLRDRIAEVLTDASEAISARGLEIFTSEMTEPLWIDADSARLRQVLSNLLDNAIKFTEPGGRIHLTACRAGQDLIVRVRDTGRGLRPHELASIFELFSQVRPGEGRGLGIGLAVAWEIVALHRGRIEAHSAGPSCGTEFIVTLPSAT